MTSPIGFLVDSLGQPTKNTVLTPQQVAAGATSVVAFTPGGMVDGAGNTPNGGLTAAQAAALAAANPLGSTTPVALWTDSTAVALRGPAGQTVAIGGGGSGTVTSVSVAAPAAGITASVATSTTTPAITLALADDLAAVEGLAATGIVRRTAANTWSAGTAVDLAAEVTGVLPTAAGGTGVATRAAYAPIFGGTTPTGPTQSGTAGTAGQVLTSNGGAALPTFQALPTTAQGVSDTLALYSNVGVLAGMGGVAWDNVATTLAFSGASILKVQTAAAGTSTPQAASTAFVSNVARYDTTLHNAFSLGAGNLTMTGVQNVGSGELCMISLTSGNYNSGYGYGSHQLLSSGSYNTANGNLSQQLITTGTANTGTGYQAGQRITSGSYNNNFGFRAGGNLTTGTYNVSMGSDCFFTATTATQNTHIGYKTGYLNLAGVQCTGVGYQALYTNTAGYNSAFGSEVLFSNTTGTENSAGGRQSLYANTTGLQNTAWGTQSMLSNTTGSGNSGFGAFSLGHNISGVSNTGTGRASLWYNTTGSNNVGIGYRCGYGNSTGSDGVSIGFYTAHNTLVAEKNTLVGSQSDYYTPAATLVATPSAGSELVAGTYAYRVAFVLDGVETGQIDSATSSAVTSGGNLRVTLTVIPVYAGPKTCSARKIYRTPKYVTTIDDNLYYLAATIADNTTTSYVDSTPDGSLGAAPPAHTGSIALGYKATLYKDGQFVVGSTAARITEMFVGGGVDDTAPAAVTHSASTASSTNVAGAPHRLTGGKGTGSASGGPTIIAGAPAGVSGASANPLVDWFSFSAEGFVGIKQAAAANVPTPAAGVCNLFFDTDGMLKFRNPAGTVRTVTAV